MQLLSLKVRNLRILAQASLDVSADLVVLTGANGSGKTSVLEAIHLLGTGRSFRTRPVVDVLSRGTNSLIVSGRFQSESGVSVTLGIEKERKGGGRYRVSGSDVRTASELARQLPLVVVTPDSQRLLSDGSEGRRRLLDWLLFHVEPGYQELHARYRRALRQRNAMLRGGVVPRVESEGWSDELARSGEALAELRSRRLEAAQPRLEQALSELSALPISLDYRQGWTAGKSLSDVLTETWEADRSRGFTASGPHRADLAIRVHGRAAQHVVSRGEGKLLVFAVMAGFARVLRDELDRSPLVLVDELASELDADNRLRFSSMLKDLGLQTFVTAVSESLISTEGWGRVARFRLEQGKPLKVLQ